MNTLPKEIATAAIRKSSSKSWSICGAQVLLGFVADDGVEFRNPHTGKNYSDPHTEEGDRDHMENFDTVLVLARIRSRVTECRV
ncbi:hypothetical protein GR217_35225 [Rhizobium leguminosarum]|uniref:Uncharacterized protein n=1 Tax=Rhizobium ruizarguesonis TaxID=2081791 RepID=A0AAE4YZ26_9HYPH|nr:hypothetical protein [Rhizobium ruizarguesonis]NEI52863.1 hypothetical protein [Rhizobium ruizarguesonis]